MHRYYKIEVIKIELIKKEPKWLFFNTKWYKGVVVVYTILLFYDICEAADVLDFASDGVSFF